MTARILLVDDDDLRRAALAKVLTNGGFEVCAASNAAAALILCAEDAKFAVLVADLTLAGRMEGPELATMILQRGAVRHVLFISNRRDQQVFLAGHAGPCHMLAKPFGGQELLDAVATMIGEQGPSPR